MATTKYFFVIFVILHAANCLSIGDVTAESELIFQNFYYHSGSDDGTGDRSEIIITEEDINAIRGIDVSGQNGDAVITKYSPRSITVLIYAEDVGRGYNYSLELYTKRESSDGGPAAKRLSVMAIVISLTIVLMCFKRI